MLIKIKHQCIPISSLYAPVLLIKKIYFKIMYHTEVIPVTRFRRKTANRPCDFLT